MMQNAISEDLELDAIAHPHFTPRYRDFASFQTLAESRVPRGACRPRHAGICLVMLFAWPEGATALLTSSPQAARNLESACRKTCQLTCVFDVGPPCGVDDLVPSEGLHFGL